MIDKKGFRLGVVMVLLNEHNRVFWARRIGSSGWQFPQGGLDEGETPEEAMYRELHEEVGLMPEDVEVLEESPRWYYYYLPKHLVRRNTEPQCIGQRQKWFLLRVKDSATKFDFSKTEKPEFEGFRWVSYWYPLRQVIFFKRKMYKRALKSFSNLIFKPAEADADAPGEEAEEAC
jgi:putative (di)nucleoside polyphosphate hydrolase